MGFSPSMSLTKSTISFLKSIGLRSSSSKISPGTDLLKLTIEHCLEHTLWRDWISSKEKTPLTRRKPWSSNDLSWIILFAISACLDRISLVVLANPRVSLSKL